MIIDLNMDSVASNTDSRGRTLVPAVLNDKMQIVMGKDSDLYHWDGTSVQPQWAKLGDFAGRETRPTPSSGLAYTNSNRIYSNYSFPIQDNDLPFYFDESSIASFPLEFESPTSAPQFALGVPTELLRHRTIVARFDQFAVAEEAWPPDTCPDDQTCDPKPIEYSIQSPNFILPKTTRAIRISSRINPHSAAPGISRTGKIATSEYLLDESSWKYRIGSVDVPDYVTALTSDPLDRDLIIVGESTSTKRYRNEAWETMPLPGIMDMNKGGTGITYPDQQIWRNGKTIVLDTLLSESIWENIQVEQINKDGALLGSAEPKGSNTIKPVLLLPVDIKVVKEGETSAPEDGLVVKKTDTVRYRLSPGLPDGPLLLEDKIQWHWRILKWNGTYSGWTAYEDGQGHTFTAQPEDAGIYEVKATVEGQDFFLKRATDDPHSAKKKDENECFGVVDQDWQINVRNQAKANLGSVAYATNAKNLPLEVGDNKCNLFVAHKATDGGAVVPWINGVPPFTSYPPIANQWEGTDPKIIPHWTLLPVETYPQPGFVVAVIGIGQGHCGILDHDGSWISAGPTNVNRKADLRNEISLRSGRTIYQTAKFRKYTP